MDSAPARTAPRDAPAHLRIALLVPRTDVGGGARILFEHANRLWDRGHAVTVVSYLPAPDWFDLRAPFIQASVGARLIDAAPPCDLIVCGYWDQIRQAASAHLAPVVHFEQGDFHLFEELDAPTKQLVRSYMEAADAHTAVSGAVQEILDRRYGQSSDVIPNAVDPLVFHPSHGVTVTAERRYILSVGWDGNTFKGIAEVREAASLLKVSHPDVDVVWVTPKPPVGDLGDIARVVVSPSQVELGALYRSAAAYVCASHYESFPLPPMEAMASGTPVVTTDNPGSLQYAQDGVNALVVPIGDAPAIHAGLSRVLDDDAVATSLREAGLATAAGYTWESIVDRLEVVYSRIAGEFASQGDDLGWTTPEGDRPVPADDTARERLDAVKRRSGAARLLVPVRHPVTADLATHQWRVVATRGDGIGDCHVFAPHRSTEPPSSLSYQQGVNLFRAGNHQQALHLFRGAEVMASSDITKGALPRWIALCLTELDRRPEALATLSDAAGRFPDNLDLYRMAASLAESMGYVVDQSVVASLDEVIGSGSRYEDFFAVPAPRAHS